ncbi:matrix metalloproteinase-2-like isoform X2 [Pectinophora gossypiella]|nr:matrix metalloproteinase-2-like isoform X2 [Pectinophora gossypiella]XP_049866773.1 matrix metalloproteinase-2-like isoform X2 [Pectinophora gossypiella]
MRRYGYLPEGSGDVDYAYTPHSISAAVKKMQEFAGLPPTGMLDLATKKLFKKRRCGVKDIGDTSSRHRRYILRQGWNKRSITYRIINGSSTLEKARVEEGMAHGLSVWAPHGGLQFYKLDDGAADIEVSFASGDHGDGFPFDGPGRVVAHAFPPPHGAMHFDDDEIWGSDPEAEDEDVTDFFAVAVHEIGHALGLSHSSVKASVMYPYYQVPVERLHMDDILGMQELYLKDQLAEATEAPANEILSTPQVPRFTKADDDDDIPDLCFTNYDTLQVIQGMIFVFEEEWVWVFRERRQLEPGYPRRYHEVFVGLPEHVNAIRTIYEMRNRNIRIFAGRRYWEFDRSFHLINKGTIYEYGIPRQIAELTTVFVSNYNNKTYLIEYEQFWRYDDETKTIDRGYPKEMSAWRQVPYPVDSALIWKGDTYFFRGPRFWRFDNTLVRAHEYYPLPTAQIWFDCPTSPDMDRYVVNDDS